MSKLLPKRQIAGYNARPAARGMLRSDGSGRASSDLALIVPARCVERGSRVAVVFTSHRRAACGRQRRFGKFGVHCNQRCHEPFVWRQPHSCGVWCVRNRGSAFLTAPWTVIPFVDTKRRAGSLPLGARMHVCTREKEAEARSPENLCRRYRWAAQKSPVENWTCTCVMAAAKCL